MLQVNTVVPALWPYGNTNSGIYGNRGRWCTCFFGEI